MRQEEKWERRGRAVEHDIHDMLVSVDQKRAFLMN